MSDILFPANGATVNLAATTTTSRVQLPAHKPDSLAMTIRVVSPPTNGIAFIRCGGPSVTASAADLPIMPNTVEAFRAPAGTTHIAAITGTGAATLYFSVGLGA